MVIDSFALKRDVEGAVPPTQANFFAIFIRVGGGITTGEQPPHRIAKIFFSHAAALLIASPRAFRGGCARLALFSDPVRACELSRLARRQFESEADGTIGVLRGRAPKRAFLVRFLARAKK